MGSLARHRVEKTFVQERPARNAGDFEAVSIRVKSCKEMAAYTKHTRGKLKAGKTVLIRTPLVGNSIQGLPNAMQACVAHEELTAPRRNSPMAASKVTTGTDRMNPKAQ